MKKSINKQVKSNNKKFYNVYKGKNESNYFFVLPCISISPKKTLNWDMTIKSYFFAWFRSFIQYNVCEIISDDSNELTKELFENLTKILKDNGIVINDTNLALAYIKNNIYIVKILRNSNIKHHYVNKILSSYFQNQNFVSHSS